jgi:leucyl aminopeptidase
MTDTPALALDYGHLADVAADWLVLPVPAGDLPLALRELDARLGGVLDALGRAGDLTGKPGELLPLWHVSGIAARRVLCTGIGPEDTADRGALERAVTAAVRLATSKPLGRLAVALPRGLHALTDANAVLAAGVASLAALSTPAIHKTEPARFRPSEVVLANASDTSRGVEPARQRADAEGRAVALARDLVNTPPAELYPESFAAKAVALAAAAGVTAEVWDESRLTSERMNALLGVARGSDRPPRMVVLRYAGSDSLPVAYVGKGVTFDSGGLSLKTSEQMADMKCDMAGAAAVLAATVTAARLKLPVNLLAVLPLVENMPGGRAMKLGDVLTARNGVTIEVLNTDAEGRLILADALAYAVDAGAAHVVDLATLTGACMVALGTEVAGLMTNDEPWGHQVLAAAQRAGERAWPLPMDAHYDELLKSNVADVKNTAGGRYGGAIAGGKFLERFVGATPWAHLDIAGPAWVERENGARDAGATGYGVRALVQLAHDLAAEGERPA